MLNLKSDSNSNSSKNVLFNANDFNVLGRSNLVILVLLKAANFSSFLGNVNSLTFVLLNPSNDFKFSLKVIVSTPELSKAPLSIFSIFLPRVTFLIFLLSANASDNMYL